NPLPAQPRDHGVLFRAETDFVRPAQEAERSEGDSGLIPRPQSHHSNRSCHLPPLPFPDSAKRGDLSFGKLSDQPPAFQQGNQARSPLGDDTELLPAHAPEPQQDDSVHRRAGRHRTEGSEGDRKSTRLNSSHV